MKRKDVGIELDFSKLRGRIVEKYGTLGKFADATGATLDTISNKVNNKTTISRDEIITWSDLLEIDNSDIGTYFFCSKSL